jgi:hypothetical protein
MTEFSSIAIAVLTVLVVALALSWWRGRSRIPAGAREVPDAPGAFVLSQVRDSLGCRGG